MRPRGRACWRAAGSLALRVSGLFVHSLFIIRFIKSAHVYQSFPTSIFRAHPCSPCSCRLRCVPLSPREDSVVPMHAGSGGVGSYRSSVPHLALNRDTEPAQLANSCLSEHVPLSPCFWQVPGPGGGAPGQRAVQRQLWRSGSVWGAGRAAPAEPGVLRLILSSAPSSERSRGVLRRCPPSCGAAAQPVRGARVARGHRGGLCV